MDSYAVAGACPRPTGRLRERSLGRVLEDGVGKQPQKDVRLGRVAPSFSRARPKRAKPARRAEIKGEKGRRSRVLLAACCCCLRCSSMVQEEWVKRRQGAASRAPGFFKSRKRLSTARLAQNGAATAQSTDGTCCNAGMSVSRHHKPVSSPICRSAPKMPGPDVDHFLVRKSLRTRQRHSEAFMCATMLWLSFRVPHKTFQHCPMCCSAG